MAFIAAKCPECGGAIQLDDSKESGFCMYCGTKVFLKESIAQRVRVEGIQTLEGKLENAETYAKLGETEQAIRLLTQLTEEYTSDYRAWWLLAIIKSNAYHFFIRNSNPGTIDKIGVSKEYRYAFQLASDADRKHLVAAYERYRKQVEKNMSEFIIEEQKKRLLEQEELEKTRKKNEEKLRREEELKAIEDKKLDKKAKRALLIFIIIIVILVVLQISSAVTDLLR